MEENHLTNTLDFIEHFKSSLKMTIDLVVSVHSLPFNVDEPHQPYMESFPPIQNSINYLPLILTQLRVKALLPTMNYSYNRSIAFIACIAFIAINWGHRCRRFVAITLISTEKSCDYWGYFWHVGIWFRWTRLLHFTSAFRIS